MFELEVLFFLKIDDLFFYRFLLFYLSVFLVERKFQLGRYDLGIGGYVLGLVLGFQAWFFLILDFVFYLD